MNWFDRDRAEKSAPRVRASTHGRHELDRQLAIRIEALRVVRGGRTVIPGLDLTVRRGQLVGLLGPSGCGKSTLMRSIVGVQKVTGGSVEVFGQPAGSSGLRSRTGYLTQQPSVYQDLTVIENLRYFAKVIGLPRKKLDDEVSRLLNQVDLADHASARAGSLSGGQLSRVSLAAALVGAPELLVLDEPTVGLDPVLRRDLWSIFRRLTQAGVTLLVSSHVMDEAVRCDRLLLMRNGTMLADDTLRGVLESTGALDPEQAFLTLVDRAAARQTAGQAEGDSGVGGASQARGGVPA
jgi:ABC-2 type transport system ATP-binding protein